MAQVIERNVSENAQTSSMGARESQTELGRVYVGKYGNKHSTDRKKTRRERNKDRPEKERGSKINVKICEWTE